MDHVRAVHSSKATKYSNIISSHALYKVRANDTSELYITARLLPHGIDDSMKSVLKIDANSCSSSRVWVVCRIITIIDWPIFKVELDSAFLQSDSCTRDVCVCLPNESGYRVKFYWFLLVTSYRPVNESLK